MGVDVIDGMEPLGVTKGITKDECKKDTEAALAAAGTAIDARRPNYRDTNMLASGVPPIGAPDDGETWVDLYGDRAYGSRDTMRILLHRGIDPNILHKINVTAKGKGSRDA